MKLSVSLILLQLLQPIEAQPQITLGPSITAVLNVPITDIQAIPSDTSRLFVVTRSGRIRILRNFASGSGASYDTTDFLDISSRILTGTGGSEQGLLGLAFDPEFETNGYFYLDYSKGSNGDTVIARYSVSTTNPNQGNFSSETVLEVLAQPFANHNGGQIHFGPDKMLYVGMGDGGSAGDPGDRAQSKTSLLGKMLRFNVTNSVTGARNAWSPAGSPNLDNTFNSTIWAWGLRNPWRWSFDRATGDMLIADVGQNAWEEVSFQPSDSNGGENYGWRPCEGFYGYNPSGSNCNAGSNVVPGYKAPIFNYCHTSLSTSQPCYARGNSITGGYVYRGSFASLQGVYFYGDYVSGWIRGAINTASNWETVNPSYTNVLTNIGCSVTTFGEDANGEMYVGCSNGGVMRILLAADPTNNPSASPTNKPTAGPTKFCNKNLICEANEDCSCSDCFLQHTITVPSSFCGNGFCEPDETCTTCASDCNGQSGGRPATRFCCSNTVASTSCNDSRCTQNGFNCADYQNTTSVTVTTCCGDGDCTSGFENSTSCSADCQNQTPGPTPNTPNPTPNPTAGEICAISGQKAKDCGAKGSVPQQCCTGFVCNVATKGGLCKCDISASDPVVYVGPGDFSEPYYPLSGSGSWIAPSTYRITKPASSGKVVFVRSALDNTHPFELCRSSTLNGGGCPPGDSIKVLSDPNDCAIVDVAALQNVLYFDCVPHSSQMYGQFTFVNA